MKIGVSSYSFKKHILATKCSYLELCNTVKQMGFSGIEDKGSVGKAFEMFPLAFALSTADMEATYFLEGEDSQ